MKFVELVNQYNHLKYKIRRLQLKEQELRELQRLPHNGMSGFGGGHSSSAVEGYVVALAQITGEIERLELESVSLRERITSVLDKLSSDSMREVLEMRLLLHKTWRYIAVSVYYSEAHVRRLYNIGIKEVQEYEA